MSDASDRIDQLTPLQRAAFALKDLRSRLDAVEQARREPIAIIGMSCRFPGGARDPESYWNLLLGGFDAITEVPPSRWDIDAFASANPTGTSSTRFGGFLEELEQFDALFFGIAPREALHMDPQQRLLLEVGWSALEDAGIAPDRLSGESVGVYVGISTNEYALRMGDPTQVDGHMLTGNALSVAAGRLSYSLGLQGPSVAIDTACSSSLVAVHLACQSLRQGECRMALAGGANVLLSPLSTLALADLNALASDGHCKTFDASADGYVRGEGCGLIVLKRLSDALADGDRILATIRGSAVNQDGRSASLTAPNGPAQEAVIRSALASAGVEPSRIGYVEAHGTGTPLGDPIELRALTAVLGSGRDHSRPFRVGSVKTNIGHLESAAGIAGLIKAVLCLQHVMIPPHLHFHQLNSHLRPEDLPLTIPTEPTEWSSDGTLRVAGVSSFGFSGTNAHVVLEEAPARSSAPLPTRPQEILILSARSDESLKAMATRLSDYLASHPSDSLEDVCSTASRRSHFPHRLAIVFDTNAKAVTALEDFVAGRASSTVTSGQAAGRLKVAFLCPGQGTQYPGMGSGLTEHCPAFRDAFEACGEILRPQLDVPLRTLVDPTGEGPSLLKRTAYAQPALVAMGWASAAAWRSFGVEPEVVMGHSLGEITAAAIAGILSIEDALKLAVARGRLMEDLPIRGVMTAVAAGPDEVASVLVRCGPGVEIAAWNGPSQTVIAGPEPSMDLIEADLRLKGLASSRLEGRHAFHTAAIEPVLPSLREVASRLEYRPAKVRLVSNLTGRQVDVLDANHWAEHARNPVRFGEGLSALASLGCTAFVELAPGSTLLGLAKRSQPSVMQANSTHRGVCEWKTFLEAVAKLYTAGALINWHSLQAEGSRRPPLRLPTYPFQRQRYWIEPSQSDSPQLRSRNKTSLHSLGGRKVRSAGQDRVREYDFGVEQLPFLKDHRVFERVVVPGACHLSLALGAGRVAEGSRRVLENVVFPEALALPEEGTRTVQLVERQVLDGTTGFQVLSLNEWDSEADESWTLHASGSFGEIRVESTPGRETIETIQSRCETESSVDDFYRQVAERGVDLGPGFRWIEKLWQGDREALGRMRAPRDPDEALLFPLHPGLIDSCIQLVVAAFPKVEAGDDPYIPIGLQRLCYHGRSEGLLWGHARLRPGGEPRSESFTGDFRLFNTSGKLVIEIDGLHFKRAARETFLRSGQSRVRDDLYELAWRPRLLPSERMSSPARWMILADSEGVATGLADRLRQQGDTCILVGMGSDLGTRDRYVDPTRPEDIDRVVRDIFAEGSCDGVIDLWPLEATMPSEASVASLEQAQDLGCRATLNLVQALSRSGGNRSPRLWIVTRGAQAIGDDSVPLAPSQATLWGLGRVVIQEHPELRCSLVDLETAGSSGEVDALSDEIRAADREDQVALRGGRRLVARLVQSKARAQPAAPSENQPFRLQIATPGVLDSLTPTSIDAAPPGPGQVQIRVAYTGINFRDVLSGLGLYPGDPGPLGAECSGVISAVGAGVDRFFVGESVLALAPGSLASHVNVDAQLVAPKPDWLPFAQASTIPVAFLTADLALFRIARLQPGQTVLIHAATGGLGLAACQMAQRAGLQVIATAGSSAKRALLRRLGIKHIFDSRRPGFGDAARQATGGRGVDAVLNSLSDPLIEEGLLSLALGGYFLEVGKIGIWDHQKVAELRSDVSYQTIALDALGRDNPEAVGTWLGELVGRMDQGTLTPVSTTAVDLIEAPGAFRRMAQARHVGKLAVRMSPSRHSPVSIRPDSTYLITGGLGGLGLQVASWLADRGARFLVLAGRRGLEGAEALAAVSKLEASGVRVVAERADISRSEGAADLLKAIERAGLPPLKGVVHAAGVLDDGALSGQNWERFEAVLGPKVGGAWGLHLATMGFDLDFFALFSSAAGLLGSAGQGSYAAGNAFLDGLASHRRSQGLPATSIAWGPWAGSGMAAKLGEAERDRWREKGLGLIEPSQGLEIFGRILDRGDVNIGVLPIDWPRYLRGASGNVPPLLEALIGGTFEAIRTVNGRAPMREEWEACPAAQRRDLLLKHVREQAIRVLGLDPSHPLGGHQPLNEVGLDSLLAVELRSVLAASTGLALPATLLFNYPSVEALADCLVAELEGIETAPASIDEAEKQAEEQLARARDEVEKLSEDELDGLLTGFATQHLKDLDRA